MIKITTPTENALETSIRNNIFFYYVMVFTWIGFLLYAQAYRDTWLYLDSLLFLISACYFGLGQKIDKARLENMRK